MGCSAQAILIFGVALPEEYEGPWDQEGADFEDWVQQHGDGDAEAVYHGFQYDRGAIAVEGSVQSVQWGEAREIDLDCCDHFDAADFRKFMREHLPDLPCEPKWLLLAEYA